MDLDFDGIATETVGDIAALVGSLSLIMVIKFGVGGIWAARDSFWPAVYGKLGAGQDRPK